MEFTIFIAIILGAIIIAKAIEKNSAESNHYDDYEDGYAGKTIYDNWDKEDAIKKGLKRGLNAQEIYDQNSHKFTSADEFNSLIEELNLLEDFEEIDKKRKDNPNLLIELEIAELKEEIERLKRTIKEDEEDFALAKETNDFEAAKASKDSIKYEKLDLDTKKKKLKELENSLNK